MSKISIIIPVYNVEAYLDKCLQSVINQTFKYIEIICINDGSSDNSLSILKKYETLDDRIIVIDQENQGPSGARNSGLKKATSPYIMFVDSDDWLEPNACEILYHSITTNDCDLVQTKIHLHYHEFQHFQHSDEIYFNSKSPGLYNLISDNLLTCDHSVWGKLWKKEIIDRYQICFPEGLLYEDFSFTIEYLAVSQKILIIEDRLYNYLRRPNSIMSKTYAISSEMSLDHTKVFFDIYSYLKKWNLFEKFETTFWILFENNFWRTLNALHRKNQILAFNLASSFMQDKQIDHLKDRIDQFYKMDKMYKIDHSIFKTLINLKNKNYNKIISIISIIIPVYNVEAYLDKCLQSVINQTFKYIEIICINDGSSDNSLSILKKYETLDDRIIVIDQENQGLSGARNSGLKKATSPYIMFVDSDDWLEPNACEFLYHYITTNDCDLVQTKIHLHYHEFQHFQYDDEFYFNSKSPGLYTLTPDKLGEYYVSAWGKLWKKEIIDKYNISFPLGLNFEDHLFSFEYLAVSQKILIIENRLYNYLRRPNSIISESKKKNSISELDRIKIFFDVYSYLKKWNLFEKFETTFWILFENNFWRTLHALHRKNKILAFNLASSFMQDKQIEHVKDKIDKIDKMDKMYKIDHLIFKTLINLKNKNYNKIYTIKPQSFIGKLIKLIFYQKIDRNYKSIKFFGLPIYTRNSSMTRYLFLEKCKNRYYTNFILSTPLFKIKNNKTNDFSN